MISIVLILLCVQNAHLLNTGVQSEIDRAKIIFVHEPSQEVNFKGNLHRLGEPFGPINVSLAQQQHQEMRKVIASMGAEVYVLRDVLLNGTEDKNSKESKDLVEFAAKTLTYDLKRARKEFKELLNHRCDNEEQQESLRNELRLLKPQLTRKHQEDYKYQMLTNLTPDELVNIVLTRPTIELSLKPLFGKKAVSILQDSTTILRPLQWLYFTRDQQITTKKGIIILPSKEREHEEIVTEFALKKLGLNAVHKVNTGYADGGDYIPYGNIAFFGEGILTDMAAIEEIMENDLFGIPEIAVVHDYSDFSMDRMHLDTFFSILDENKNVLLDENVLNNPSYQRHVDLYSNKPEDTNLEKNGNGKKYGNYVLVEQKVEFGEFLKKRGFNISTITGEQQRNYAPNFLHLGNGTIVTPYCESSLVNRLKTIGINVICVDVSELTKGYGAIHCMTQVVHRT